MACAALGAFAGDGLSYWIGHRWGPQLREHWPFRRYPQLLDRGERLFRRHGSKGIVIARYVGAVRPFVPAIAGMLRMPLRRYVPASAVRGGRPGRRRSSRRAGCFGASYDAVAAVADRLALVLVALLAVLALVWAAVLYTWRWFARPRRRLLARALALDARASAPGPLRRRADRSEPAGIRVAGDARRRACWRSAGRGSRCSAMVLAGGGPLPLDHSVHDAMVALRNPLADRLMAALATLGDAAGARPGRGGWRCCGCCGGDAGSRRRTGWRRSRSAWR